jgi:hypothetical protein
MSAGTWNLGSTHLVLRKQSVVAKERESEHTQKVYSSPDLGGSNAETARRSHELLPPDSSISERISKTTHQIHTSGECPFLATIDCLCLLIDPAPYNEDDTITLDDSRGATYVPCALKALSSLLQ